MGRPPLGAGTRSVGLGLVASQGLFVKPTTARAVLGRLADLQPTLVTHLAGRNLRAEVSPDGHWALVTDRVDAVRLVRLPGGRAWPVDRDRMLMWSDAV